MESAPQSWEARTGETAAIIDRHLALERYYRRRCRHQKSDSRSHHTRLSVRGYLVLPHPKVLPQRRLAVAGEAVGNPAAPHQRLQTSPNGLRRTIISRSTAR